jgi:hypothetical protein
MDLISRRDYFIEGKSKIELLLGVGIGASQYILHTTIIFSGSTSLDDCRPDPRLLVQITQ